MKPTLTCFEHQTLSKTDFTAPQDFDWLITQNLACFSIHWQQQPVLKAKHYLSLICLPSGQWLEILPKISQHHDPIKTRQWVKQMLTDIYHISHPKPLSALSKTKPNVQPSHPKNTQTWYQSLIDHWLNELSQIIKILPRHYQSHQTNQPQAKGKILLKEQLKKNAHRPHYLITQKSQLQQSPLWQRFFFTALLQLNQGFRHWQTNHQKTSLLQQLKSQPLPPEQWQTSYQTLQTLIQPNQYQPHQIQQLRQVLDIAWLLLQPSLNIPNQQGSQTIPAIIIDLQHAFEQWVSQYLYQQLHQQSISHINQSLKTQLNPLLQHPHQNHQVSLHISQQHRLSWLTDDMGNSRELKPDIIISQSINITTNSQHQVIKTSPSSPTPLIIADIKYKQLDKTNQVSTNDLYQLFTYLNLFHAKQAWLIFPKTDQFQQPKTLYINSNHQPSTTQTSLTIKLIPFDVQTGACCW